LNARRFAEHLLFGIVIMSKTAIQVEHLSKLYHLGRRQERHDTLRDALVGAVGGLRRKSPRDSEQDTIWALSDISFDVMHGRAIGIIGRNGAGKSTLLKILSQITDPTSGRVVINGRVGSLLEVGTGFHPELTGAENIYLNGAILGMSRQEITRKFDEIVDFAEIEKFLDTPVKRYSSGMYVRLAFAVAAHLEPEILLVDEVLAVGDIEFQKKCLGKMSEVTEGGRTILFVSHNMNIIQRLCQTTILLSRGKITSMGDTVEVIQNYLYSGLEEERPGVWIDITKTQNIMQGTTNAYFSDIWYSSQNPACNFQPYPDGPLEIRLRVFSDSSRIIDSLAVSFYDQTGSQIVNTDTITIGEQLHMDPGMNVISLKIKALHLKPGIYSIGLWLANPPYQVFDFIDQILKVEVIDTDTQKFGIRPTKDGSVTCDFSVQKLSGLAADFSK
jgi:lipopolysaccharide transport system ATP-binding protein